MGSRSRRLRSQCFFSSDWFSSLGWVGLTASANSESKNVWISNR